MPNRVGHILSFKSIVISCRPVHEWPQLQELPLSQQLTEEKFPVPNQVYHIISRGGGFLQFPFDETTKHVSQNELQIARRSVTLGVTNTPATREGTMKDA